MAGFVAACVLCLLLGAAAAFAVLHFLVGSEGIALLQEQALIRTRLVGEYDPDLIRQEAERAMVDSLGDRWSYYLTPEQLQETRDTRKNSYVGIGITIQEDEQGLLILSVSPRGPADQAGVLPGEIICAVDGIAVRPDNREEAVDRIRGEEGTVVTLDILDRSGGRRTVEITRGRVNTISASWEMLGELIW